MKLFTITALFALLTSTAFAQDNEGMEFFEKPVLCMDKDVLIYNSKENGLQPLVGALGNSFTGSLVEGQAIEPAYFLLLFNAEQGNYSFVQFRKNGTACMLGGGWNGLMFDLEEISEQIGW